MHKQCFSTQLGPKAVGPYNTAVRTGDLVFLSGMIPINPATGKPVTDSIEAETRQVLDNLRVVLSEMGLTLQHAVKVVVYLTDMADFAAVNALYGEAFGPAYPARTCVEVSKLPLGVHVEIDVTAAVQG